MVKLQGLTLRNSYCLAAASTCLRTTIAWLRKPSWPLFVYVWWNPAQLLHISHSQLHLKPTSKPAILLECLLACYLYPVKALSPQYGSIFNPTTGRFSQLTRYSAHNHNGSLMALNVSQRCRTLHTVGCKGKEKWLLENPQLWEMV